MKTKTMANDHLGNEESRKMIKQLNLRNTRLRDEVLKHFKLNVGIAFSENELRESVGVSCDRTTIYRTIKILLQKAVIHRIICESGMLKYALNEAEPLPHVHFQCVQCQRVFCLNDYKVNPPHLPEEFEAQSYQFLVKGNCHHCPECPKNNRP